MSVNTVQPIGLLLKVSIFVVGMFAFLQVYSIQAILPVLMQTFLASETWVGLTVGATVLAIALMSPFMGMLSDAYGRKPFIVAAMLALAIPTALIGFADSLDAVIGWRFLQGLAVPAITVVTIAYIAEEFVGNAVAKLMAFYVAGTVLGGFLGRFLLGHLEQRIGWQQGFYVMAGLTLIGAMWVAWQLPKSRRFIPNPNFGSSLQILKQHATNRYVITACLLGFCVLFSLVGCFTFINLHLADKPYLLDSGGLANIFSVYLLGVVITPIASNLTAYFGAARTVQMAVMLSMLGVLITLGRPLWAVILGLTVMSSGVFITQAATITYIAVNVKQGRSLASGLYYLCYYLGGTAGAWLCGLAYTYGKWTTTVWFLLTMQGLALLMAIFGMVKTQSGKLH
ncbi:major facilitator superfamily transporter [Moraxella macacae 0408225]|uniref:Major facilitator superfamily transporter n=1 Tax=Moraxella macacae 0408225 TaxID=1230338 RepID=L2F7C5_9GAMM|nr:MFS transporter [Moraxella macacae]ELA08363.1 major facilitator superfamily transporter [Moraxella macacae 0408225]